MQQVPDCFLAFPVTYCQRLHKASFTHLCCFMNISPATNQLKRWNKDLYILCCSQHLRRVSYVKLHHSHMNEYQTTTMNNFSQQNSVQLSSCPCVHHFLTFEVFQLDNLESCMVLAIAIIKIHVQVICNHLPTWCRMILEEIFYDGLLGVSISQMWYVEDITKVI